MFVKYISLKNVVIQFFPNSLANSGGIQLFHNQEKKYFGVLDNESIIEDSLPIPATPEVYCVGRFGHGGLEIFVEDGELAMELQERFREYSDTPGTHKFAISEVGTAL